MHMRGSQDWLKDPVHTHQVFEAADNSRQCLEWLKSGVNTATAAESAVSWIQQGLWATEGTVSLSLKYKSCKDTFLPSSGMIFPKCSQSWSISLESVQSIFINLIVSVDGTSSRQ